MEHPHVVYGTVASLKDFAMQAISVPDWSFERDRMIMESAFGRLPCSEDAVILVEVEELCVPQTDKSFNVIVRHDFISF